MNLGDTFVFYDGHLWVVISDPGPDGEVAVVNFSRWEANRDQSCVVEVGEHRWVTKKTMVYYEMAEVLSIEEQKRKLKFGTRHDPVSPELLAKIHLGSDSDHCPGKVEKMVIRTAARLRKESGT